METKLQQYLLDAVGKNFDQVSLDNPFKAAAFDNGKARLGWVKTFSFNEVEKAIKKVLPVLEGKDTFIFLGIGGSGNGIKALLSLFPNRPFYTLDSLDPQGLDEVLKNVKDKTKTLVVSISKSGTTKETQLLALAMKEYFGLAWKNSSLWLSDPEAFSKLDQQGWNDCAKAAIQLDGFSDVGGRFSCPGTMIFLLPLFLLLNKDFNKLKVIYDEYLGLQSAVRLKALGAAQQYAKHNPAFFNVKVSKKTQAAFYPWVVQLFQESLGSKRPDFSVKTLNLEKPKTDLLELELQMEINDELVKLMANMYFFQLFTAFFAGLNNINFVDQNLVEKYKAQMRQMEQQQLPEIPCLRFEAILAQVKENLKPEHKFIEVVLYFNANQLTVNRVKEQFSRAFADKEIFVFIGSDWNHHSFQAAFEDPNTYFALLLKSDYQMPIKGVSKAALDKNIETLKLISLATHVTISNKAILVKIAQ